MATYAKVAIESPLPQLDRLFDYEVPNDLIKSIRVGQTVSVPFGKGVRGLTGFVVELTDEIEYQGQLSQISSLVSETIMLPPNIYKLVRAVADRQAVSFGDVAKSAIPNRAVRADRNQKNDYASVEANKIPAILKARLCEPRIVERAFGDEVFTGNAWVADALEAALESVADGCSAIICVPDFRDVDLLVEAGVSLGFGAIITRYGSELTRTERFMSHISAMQHRPQIVIGTRSALFAPLQNLGQIIIWDDEDPSHYDQSSPYISSREVALIRQTLESCSISFLSHARSLAVQRLISIGYLIEDSEAFAKPVVAFSEKDVRVDTLAFNTVRSGLSLGPVLVQVSNIGVAKSAYCKNCGVRAHCSHCTGPLWLDEKGDIRCRWCNGFNQAFHCLTCGQSKLRMGRAGSTRTAAELGMVFPGVPILEATGTSITQIVDEKPRIVVSTPGAEPQAMGGYGAVLILDCEVALARDSLHAREDAVRVWANAIALAAPGAKNALIGLTSELGKFVANWRFIELAQEELQERSTLGFPPVQRLLSATGERTNIGQLVEQLCLLDGVSKLGMAPAGTPGEWRALLRFTYAAGKNVADVVRIFQLKHSGAKRLNQKSGQHQRAVSIKIDDPRVL